MNPDAPGWSFDKTPAISTSEAPATNAPTASENKPFGVGTLFGNTTPLFGNASNPAAAASPFALGGASTPTVSSSGFSSLGGAAKSISGGSTSIFNSTLGGGPASSSGSEPFGGNSSSTSPFASFGALKSSTPASKPLFSPTTEATPATTAQTPQNISGPVALGSNSQTNMFGASGKAPVFGPSTSGSLFGPSMTSTHNSTAPEAATTPAPEKSSFGSTTPAAAPPTIFNLAQNQGTGSGSKASSLFAAPKPAAPAGGLFGHLNANQGQSGTPPASDTPSATAPPPPHNLFCGASSGTSTLFKMPAAPAATPAVTNAAPSSIFANLGKSTSTAPSLFSTHQSPAQSSAPVFSLAAQGGLGGQSASPATTPVATTASAPKPLFSAMASNDPVKTTNLFGTPVSSAPAASSSSLFTAAAPSTSPEKSLFSATPAKPAEKKSALADAPSLTSAEPSTTSSTAAAPAATASTAATSLAAAPALGASMIGPPPTAQSRLKNKTLDDILTRWATDLSKHQKTFQNQAEQVSKWDRMLTENSERISKLYARTYQAERDAAEVERQLSRVEEQQDELGGWLNKYEGEVDGMMARMGGESGLSAVDQERARVYKAAERLGERLDGFAKDLGDVIDEINEVGGKLAKGIKGDDALENVVKILNMHLQKLQAIDEGSQMLQQRVEEAAREQQASFRRSGRGSESMKGSSGSGAADEFYRSYTGSRR